MIDIKLKYSRLPSYLLGITPVIISIFTYDYMKERIIFRSQNPNAEYTVEEHLIWFGLFSIIGMCVNRAFYRITFTEKKLIIRYKYFFLLLLDKKIEVDYTDMRYEIADSFSGYIKIFNKKRSFITIQKKKLPNKDFKTIIDELKNIKDSISY